MDAFAEKVKEEPGFIGAALHRSTDGTLLNQRRAMEIGGGGFPRMSQKYREQFTTRLPAASRVDPHLYEVVYLSEQAGSR